ncbi:MAG: MbcA/ParS/Xre antitoxin family protein [Defluviicoccus sp.]|nr:MbcA/ParS/Xre antitoxin family protein [Defluviicoccus sp.]
MKLLEQWRLETGDAVALLGYDESDTNYVHSVLEGRERLRGKDVRDRIFHLYGVRRSLRFLFQDLETENAWLREPHQELNGKSPMSLLRSGSMESLLAVKDYVDIFAGR